MLCTTNLIIGYKNLSLFFSLCGWLQEKKKADLNLCGYIK